MLEWGLDSGKPWEGNSSLNQEKKQKPMRHVSVYVHLHMYKQQGACVYVCVYTYKVIVLIFCSTPPPVHERFLLSNIYFTGEGMGRVLAHFAPSPTHTTAQTHTHTDKHTHTHTAHTHTEISTHTHTHKHKRTHRHTDTQTHTHTLGHDRSTLPRQLAGVSVSVNPKP